MVLRHFRNLLFLTALLSLAAACSKIKATPPLANVGDAGLLSGGGDLVSTGNYIKYGATSVLYAIASGRNLGTALQELNDSSTASTMLQSSAATLAALAQTTTIQFTTSSLTLVDGRGNSYPVQATHNGTTVIISQDVVSSLTEDSLAQAMGLFVHELFHIASDPSIHISDFGDPRSSDYNWGRTFLNQTIMPAIQRVAQSVVGTLNPAFQKWGGAVVNSFHQGDLLVHIANTGDDGIVAVGFIPYIPNDVTTYHCVVLKLASDGTPDPGFGKNGYLEITPPSGTGEFCEDIAVDGTTLVLAGTEVTSTTAKGLLITVGMDGSFQSRSTANYGNKSNFYGMALTPMGQDRWMVVGQTTTTKLPSTWRIGGIVFASGAPVLTLSPKTSTFAGGTWSRGMAGLLSSDGRIIVAGENFDPTDVPSPVVVAFNPTTGAVDTTFGTKGVYFPTGNGAISSIAEATNKDILLGLTTQVGLASAGSVVALTTDGVVDPSFGARGEAVIGDGTQESSINAIVVRANGDIYVGGWYFSDSSSSFVARFHANGTLDTNFNPNGAIPGYSISDFGNGGAVRDLMLTSYGVAALTNLGAGHGFLSILDTLSLD